jgi:hypothetical protein
MAKARHEGKDIGKNNEHLGGSRPRHNLLNIAPGPAQCWEPYAVLLPEREGGRMLTGTCHCGAAHWTLEGDPGSITACNCTLCLRYGALWAYDYVDERQTR